MLNVFLTIDTEIWPHSQGWPVKALPSDKSDFTEEISSYIYGTTPKGDFGLPYQIKKFKEHGLKANYFVEALFSNRVGNSPLTDIVGLIQNYGHDVQLHLHTEWLSEIKNQDILQYNLKNLCISSRLMSKQSLIKKGIQNLNAAGVENVQGLSCWKLWCKSRYITCAFTKRHYL